MTQIASVIVTYNRKEKLKKNIQCIMSQTYKSDYIYVIDNASTDDTFAYIQDIISNEPRIKYLKMAENLGGAGGFYEGIKFAYEDGMDYIWGMDDDAFPHEDALEKLVVCLNEASDDYCFCSNCNKDEDFLQPIKEVRDWMFVGFFINRRVVEKVGYPRKDFFIFYDDLEYAQRIIRNGYRIYKVRDSIIDHEDTVHKSLRSKQFLGITLRYPELPDWKNYYYVRNNILQYSLSDIRRYKILLSWCPIFFIKLLIIYPRQVPVFLLAYLHGLLGVSGIKMKP